MTTAILPASTSPALVAGGVKQSPPVGKRLASIDAYRGLVMFLMLAEVLRLNEIYKKFPGNTFLSG